MPGDASCCMLVAKAGQIHGSKDAFSLGAPRMPITRMDHFTILTTDVEKTVAFYRDLLGFTPGPRPAFPFPGAWLYNGDTAVLHVIERSAIPDGGGVLDHIAFWGEDLHSFLVQLKAHGLTYDLAAVAGRRTCRRRLAIVLPRSERCAGRNRFCRDRARRFWGIAGCCRRSASCPSVCRPISFRTAVVRGRGSLAGACASLI